MKRAGCTGLFLQEIRAAVQPLQLDRVYPVDTGSFLDMLPACSERLDLGIKKAAPPFACRTIHDNAG